MMSSFIPDVGNYLASASTYAELEKGVADNCTKQNFIDALLAENFVYSQTQQHRDPKPNFLRAFLTHAKAAAGHANI